MHVSTTHPLLFALLDRNDTTAISKAELIYALRLISGFIFRRFASYSGSRGYSRWFVSSIKELKTTPIYDLFLFLQNKGFPDDQHFEGKLIEFDLYKSNYVRPVLERLERAQKHKEQADLSKAQVEHIMPQTLTPKWESELGEEASIVHENWLHTIGNLTLSAYNPELSNKPFADKKIAYDQSHITITRALAKYDMWNVD